MVGWERELADVLEKEAEIFRSLADLARNKAPALRSGDVRTVESFTGRERVLTQRLTALEERRRRQMARCGLGGRTLRELTGMARGEDGMRLRAVVPRLTAASGCLWECSRRNREVIRTQLEWTGRLLRLFTPQRRMYNSRGGESSGDLPPGLVDRRI